MKFFRTSSPQLGDTVTHEQQGQIVTSQVVEICQAGIVVRRDEVICEGLERTTYQHLASDDLRQITRKGFKP